MFSFGSGLCQHCAVPHQHWFTVIMVRVFLHVHHWVCPCICVFMHFSLYVHVIGEWADLGGGGWWCLAVFLKHSCVVMVALALMLPNLQLRGCHFGLLTPEKAMTSRLGDLLTSQDRALGGGITVGRAGHWWAG